MPLDAKILESLVLSGIPGARVQITDLRGDGSAWGLYVTAPALDGLPRLERHRRVWQVLQPRYDDNADIVSVSVGKGG